MKYEATLGSRRKIQKNIVWGSAGSRHMQHAFRRDGISSTVCRSFFAKFSTSRAKFEVPILTKIAFRNVKFQTSTKNARACVKDAYRPVRYLLSLYVGKYAT